MWIIFCLPGTLIPAGLGINRHLSNRLNGICKYIKERKIQCNVIWKTSDFIFLVCVCVCVHLLLIHFMNMDKLSSLWPVLSTKVVSENPRLKLWENFYDIVMKTAFFNFEQRYCIIRTVLLVDAFTSTCIFWDIIDLQWNLSTDIHLVCVVRPWQKGLFRVHIVLYILNICYIYTDW